MDVAIQTRIEMEPQQIKTYGTAYKNGAKLPPLLVTERPGKFPGIPSYLLLDGFHRYQALMNNGQRTVEVKIIDTPQDATPHDLRWLGSRENIKNGLPLKSKDKRATFRTYVRAAMHRKGRAVKSLREIAADLTFCTHQTVSNWMRKDFPSVYRAMQKVGEEVDNKAEGTGNRLVDMPDLSEREFRLFSLDLITKALASDNATRYALTQKIRELLSQLEEVAPCEAPVADQF